MADVEVQVIGAAQVVARLPDVDADDLGHVGVGQQTLDGERTPPAGDARDEDAPLPRSHRSQYVRLITSLSIWATARETVSSSGDFAWRSANSSWRSSE